MTELVEVQEGRARLRLPLAERKDRGPASKDTAAVFFNPAMGLNRDLSVLTVATHAKPEWQVLDGLAATGVRGLRYGVECDVPIHVEWNDWNPVSVKLLEENARLNGLEPRITQRNLSALLHEKVWHVVDVDPYGSPAPFLDAAVRAVRHNGLLGITATDTTALAGVYPNVCRRRYHAEPLHGELGHEVALRILAGATVRAAARFDASATPVIAHATDHYYRLMFRMERGATRADATMEHIGHVWECAACGERGMNDHGLAACPVCNERTRVAGPLWTGPLVDATVADAMLARAPQASFAREESLRLLTTLRAEADAQPLFYDIHKVGRRASTGSPATAAVLAALREGGHSIAPVHFQPLGVRTDASMAEMVAIVKRVA